MNFITSFYMRKIQYPHSKVLASYLIHLQGHILKSAHRRFWSV